MTLGTPSASVVLLAGGGGADGVTGVEWDCVPLTLASPVVSSGSTKGCASAGGEGGPEGSDPAAGRGSLDVR